MQFLYFDSSALVKQYIDESGSDWVSELYASPQQNRLYTALITGVEVVSAITRRQRADTLTLKERDTAIHRFRQDWLRRFQILDLPPTLMDRAMSVAEETGLRSYDAVQLAAALTLQEERSLLDLAPIIFVSADQKLNLIAADAGLTVENPNDHDA